MAIGKKMKKKKENTSNGTKLEMSKWKKERETDLYDGHCPVGIADCLDDGRRVLSGIRRTRLDQLLHRLLLVLGRLRRRRRWRRLLLLLLLLLWCRLLLCGCIAGLINLLLRFGFRFYHFGRATSFFRCIFREGGQ